MKKSSITLIEVLAIIIIIIILAFLLLTALAKPRSGIRISCANNLKQMGLVFKMYTNESEGGLYPRVQGDPPWGGDNPPPTGCTNVVTQFEFGPKSDAIYPEYLTDPNVLICPSSVDKGGVHILEDDGTGTCAYTGFIAHPSASYFYIGYLLDKCGDRDPVATGASGVKGPAQIMAMVEVLGDAMTDGDPATDALLDEDVAVAAPNGNGTYDKIRRLQEGVERWLITGIGHPAPTRLYQGKVAIMWDQIRVDANGSNTFNHKPGGCNVLYMDGHVEFIRYPVAFPAAKGWTEFMSTLSNAKPKPPS